MYFFLILFFLSLFGIVFMIGKKLMQVNTGNTVLLEEISIEAIDLDKVKHKTVKHAKKYGLLILVITLRFTVKTSFFFRKGWYIVKEKTFTFINKITSKSRETKGREVSSFLQKVSDYKNKIRELRDQIKEEEGIE